MPFSTVFLKPSIVPMLVIGLVKVKFLMGVMSTVWGPMTLSEQLTNANIIRKKKMISESRLYNTS